MMPLRNDSPNLKIEKIIKVAFSRGNGTKEDPIRRVEEYWSMRGELLFEKDSFLRRKKRERGEYEYE